MGKRVEYYQIVHRSNGKTSITLKFADDTGHDYMDLGPAEALLMIDMLRNEKPVFWHADNNYLYTKMEPVGEHEA